MGRFNDQMSRMKNLMNYGVVSENTNNGNHRIEFTAEAADGKIYGIVREGTKFYIKRTEKGKESLTESFDYIGGWNNRKDYEYNSYNNALKQFELKVRSINEAITGKGDFNAFDLDKKENLVIECTERMGKEIARQREIMSRVGEKLNEATISCSNTGVPEAPKTTSFSAKLGKPFDETANATLDTDMKKTASDPKKQSEPFGETEKAEEYKDAQYVPDNSVANKKPSGGKVVRVNEEKEDWASQGLPATPGVGSPDGHLMEGDEEAVNGMSFQGNDNPEITEETTGTPAGFAEEGEFESVEDDEVMDDDTIEMDDDFEDVEGEELDVDLEGGEELDGEEGLDLGAEFDDEEGLDSEEEFDDDDDRISELEDMIQMIMDELGLDSDELGDEESEEDFEGDDEDLYDDEESEEDFEGDDEDLYDDEESEEDFEGDEEMPEDEAETEFPMESKKRTLDRIVEGITKSFYSGANKPTVTVSIKSITGAKKKFAEAIKHDIKNPMDRTTFSDVTEDDKEDLIYEFDSFADAVIKFFNFLWPMYVDLKHVGQSGNGNKVRPDITEDEIDAVEEMYTEIGELYVQSLKGILDVRNPELYSYREILKGNNLLPGGGDITKVQFVSPDDFVEGVDGQALVKNNNFGEFDPYYVYLFYAVMRAATTFYQDFNEQANDILNANSSYVEGDDESDVDNDEYDSLVQQDDEWEHQDDEFGGMSDDAIDAMANANASKKKSPAGFAESRKARRTIKEDFDCPWETDEFMNDLQNEFDMFSDEEILGSADMYGDDELGSQDELERENNFESCRRKKTMKEDKLNDFGKHPGYRKKPMNLPPTGEDKNKWGRDWNDDSVYSEEPFGSKIGSSAPFDIVQHVTDSIMEQIKKKR
jgi:hypothetical protein